MKKILLIEDNEDIRETTAEILQLANYNVETASNGKAGVELAFNFSPDLIICDIMMPVLDGYGVLHVLHNNKQTQHTPFIFLTAKTERSDIRKGMEIGADDYITKPFAATELLNAVESRFKRTSLLKHADTGEAQPIVPEWRSINTEGILEEFTANRNTLRFKKKQVIYSEGNHPSALYFLLKGKAKSVKTNDQGKELAIDLFGEGDFLGYTALLQGSIYKETVVSMTEVQLAIIPRNEFEELVSHHPAVARQFIAMMTDSVAEKEEHLIALAYHSLRKKVAAALLRLLNKFGKKDDLQFKMDFSRESLATIAGTATESLIRTLGEFKQERLIEISDGYLIILDKKKLVQIVS